MTDVYNLCNNLYKDEAGNPLELTEGQQEIFSLVLSKKKKRVHILTATQWGKSLTIGLGILTAVATFPEKWAIVAPSNKKAKIIMGYIIDHIFDNEYTASKFEIAKGESRERIRRERSKDRLNFRHSDGTLGEVFILSTEGRRTKDVLDALMGFGAQNIVIDESSLVDDPQYVGILRMLGGHKDNFLLEIGNAMRRNHFYRSSRDDYFYKIKIDWKQAVKEDRFSQEFIDEMKRTINPQMFKMLYDCEFPDATSIDDSGYSFLLTERDLDDAYSEDIQLVGERKLCVDVSAGGDNFSTIILKAQNGAVILYREQNPDTMSLVGIIIRFAEQYQPSSILVDVIGVGKGVYDRLKELDVWGNIVVAINNGEKPENDEDYINRRAQSFWRLGEAIKSGFKLKKHQSWEELLVIKWKVQSDRKIKIKGKDEMLKEGIVSPDCFIAGTKILTPRGQVNIEELKEGEKVITPFGNRTIIKKWEVETDKLVKVSFSNGETLIGKLKHKILTKRGFVSLDTLLLTDIIEIRSKLSSFLWRIKKLLFIKEESIGLRKQADIFMPIFITEAESQQEKKNHCIIGFGWILIIKKYLRDIVFIIKTITQETITQKIWNWLKIDSISKIIWQNALVMPNIKKPIQNNLQSSAHWPLCGTNQKKGENGIGNTPKNNGTTPKQLKENVLNVERNLWDIIKQKDFAAEVVCKRQNERAGVITRLKGFAYFVKKNLWQIGIGLQNVAVISVLTESVSKTKVYNLTLDKDNVYYANNVLVENCADALALGFATANDFRRPTLTVHRPPSSGFSRFRR